MEEQAFKAAWQRVEAMLEERFGKVPDLQAILYLIGVNEFGQPAPRGKFTKEQKQDLMHIAVCTLLSQQGYYELSHLDADGWPHFKALKKVPDEGLAAQERLLQECVIRYFEMETEGGR